MPSGRAAAIGVRAALFVAAIAALAVACSDEPDGSSGGGSQAEYLLCTEPAGSWTDLTDEDENWRANAPAVGWTDESRCAIRLDTVWHTFGDEHCDWERVEHISIGLPIGTPYTGPDADPPGQDWDPFFIFNTDGAIDGLPTGQRIAAGDVPATALDTGLQTVTGRRLLIAADESALYEIQGDDARVFLRMPEQSYGCA